MKYLDKILKNVEVKWVPLANKELGITELSRGRVMSREYLAKNAGEYPVYSSQTAHNGEIGRITSFDYDGEALTWTTDGANAGTVFYRNGKFSITNVCGLIKILDSQKIDCKFLYYWLSIEAHKHVYSGMGNPKLMSNQMAKVLIPIPCPNNPEISLQIQQKIVNILDRFSPLVSKIETQLTNELKARKDQYTFYREELFSFGDSVNQLPLGNENVGKFTRGGGLQKKDFTDTGVGCIHYGQVYTYYQTYTEETLTYVSSEFAKKARMAKHGDLIIATTSENDEDVCKAVAWLGMDDIAVSSDACFYTHNLNPKYVAYYFQTEHFQKQKRAFITGTKVRRVNADDLAKIKIPIPSPEEQDRIVSILDRFDILATSICDALFKENGLKRKQYEYYRDMLLAFPKENIEE